MITQFLFAKNHSCALRNKVNKIKMSATKIQLQPLQRNNSKSNIKKLQRKTNQTRKWTATKNMPIVTQSEIMML